MMNKTFTRNDLYKLHTLQWIGRKPWSFNTHNKNNVHNTNKYFLSPVRDICSNWNVDFWFLNKKDLIVKPLESWSIVTSRLALMFKACIGKHQVHNLQTTLKTNFGDHKQISLAMWWHYIAKGGWFVRNANKKEICNDDILCTLKWDLQCQRFKVFHK